MLDRNLLRRSPNSLTIIIALGFALLTIIAGVGLLLLLGLRSSSTAVAATAVAAPLQSDHALHFPAIVLLVALLLLLLPLIWRYRRRATKPSSPR
jgi:membrane protein implicated in regulation of membrane protease activity